MAWLAAASVALLLALTPLAWRSTTADRIDRVVASSVYAPPSSAVNAVASAVMKLGSPGAVLVLSAVVAVGAWRRFGDPLLAAFCPFAVATALVAEWLVKRTVQRRRPFTAAAAHQGGVSFPSGHATGAAALAIAVVVLLVAARARGRHVLIPVLLGYAAAVGAARMVVGVHYLSDVLAGLAVATVVVAGSGWMFTRVDEVD
ncbi:MAG: phosphatase PAP2 family protein [Actinomycetota bacterium]|nr:phosphatase PAP2 family protein [Actinomycetota bacterium]